MSEHNSFVVYFVKVLLSVYYLCDKNLREKCQLYAVMLALRDIMSQ